MGKIVIWSQPGDAHAIAVQATLLAQGYDAVRISAADIPISAEVSSFIDSQSTRNFYSSPAAELVDLDADTIWLRRPGEPVLDDRVHPDDRRIARNECLKFVEGIWAAHGRRARWVNPLIGRVRGNSKLSQLKMARTVGLFIPRTLISNDPRQIRDFIASNASETVYKAYRQPIWRDGDGRERRTYTSTVTLADLPSDTALRHGPGIFQERLNKTFEVRATFFDRFDISVRIDSQQFDDAQLDWRRRPTHLMPICRIELPEEIRAKCILLMQKLHIVFGCIDFIVHGDKWTFLEVNQSGQFLWVEMRCETAPMLSTFSQFLAHPEGTPFYKPEPDEIKLADLIVGQPYQDCVRIEKTTGKFASNRRI